jgi:TRAP-type uncharacterized transport system substrate-binding protein
MNAPRRWPALVLATFLLGTAAPAIAQNDRMTIHAGPERDATFAIARDLATLVGPAAGIKVTVAGSQGSVDTLLRMRDDRGLRLGIVTEDLAAAYNLAAARGFGEAATLVAPLRAVATLHRLSFHFIVRADSAFTSFATIRGARINLGPPGGTTALSVMNFYRETFGEAIADENASFLSHEEALAKLVTDRSVDVVAIVAAQPVKLLADMRPDARRFVRLLAVTAANAADPRVSRAYADERLLARHYPTLLDADAESVAVRAVLVHHENRRGESELRVATFARALCDRFPRLLGDGDSKWREVNLAPPEPGLGWHYASPLIRSEIRRCSTGLPVSVPVPACTSAERMMRICD